MQTYSNCLYLGPEFVQNEAAALAPQMAQLNEADAAKVELEQLQSAAASQTEVDAAKAEATPALDAANARDEANRAEIDELTAQHNENVAEQKSNYNKYMYIVNYYETFREIQTEENPQFDFKMVTVNLMGQH